MCKPENIPRYRESALCCTYTLLTQSTHIHTHTPTGIGLHSNYVKESRRTTVTIFISEYAVVDNRRDTIRQPLVQPVGVEYWLSFSLLYARGADYLRHTFPDKFDDFYYLYLYQMPKSIFIRVSFF